MEKAPQDAATTAPLPDAAASERTTSRAAMLLGALWIAGAYATFLRYNAYPLWRFDVLLGMALLAIGPVLVGWLYGRIGVLARACLLGLFTYVVLRTNGVSHNVSLIGGFVIGAIGYRAEAVVVKFATVMAAVVMGWAMLGLSERNEPIRTEGAPQPVTSRNGPPPIVHLLLDEHGGKPAFDQIDRYAPGTWAAVEQTYLGHGFSVWRNAYSRNYYTVHSVPEVLGLGTTNYRPDQPHVSGPMKMIQHLSGAGYRTHLWQSEYQDFCTDNEPTSCTSYSYASLHPVAALPFSDRVKLALGAFITKSLSSLKLTQAQNALAAQLQKSGRPMPPWLTEWGAKPTPLNTLPIFDLVTERASRIQRGEAMVAHLLLPHFPFATDRNCRLKPFEKWEVRRSERPLADRSRSYAEQVMCTTRLVSRIVDAAGPDAIIVVHGDHGPRIVDRDPDSLIATDLQPADFASGYSTLFAIRIPGQPARPELDQKSVSSLLNETAEARWRKLPEKAQPDRPMVLLHQPGSYPTTEAQLPDWNGPSPSKRDVQPEVGR